MFDLDVIVPVCGKFTQRIEDFKRYGLVNKRERSVRVNLIVSGETIDGLDSGWGEGFEVRVFDNPSKEYSANIYKHYLSIDARSVDFRWLIRLDDDSSTDVDGLVSNLDRFYEHSEAFYLGDLQEFDRTLGGREGCIYAEYKSMLGDHERIAPRMQNEIECGIMSKGAVEKVLYSGSPSRVLLEKRASLSGGYCDCVMALASAISKVYPINCPFVTHLPLVHEFSLLGGLRNHIHQISRSPERENFWGGASAEGFALLTKAIEYNPTKLERSLFGKRLVVEGEDFIRIVDFFEGYRARVKLDRREFHWCEFGDKIVVMGSGEVIHRIKVEEGGGFSCEGALVAMI